MDGRRFDEMVMTLSTGWSRRTALKRIVGGVIVAAFGRAADESLAATDCKGPGRKCAKDGDCCDGARCKQGRCRCRDGRQRCGDVCCSQGTPCLDFTGSTPICFYASPCFKCQAAGKECCGGGCVDPCPAGMERDEATCGCVCSEPGETRCGNRCYGACPDGMARNQQSCVCKCVQQDREVCGTTCCPPGWECCNGSCGKPTGATCGSSSDCCQSPAHACQDGRCCRAKGAICQSAGQCCSQICNMFSAYDGYCG